MKSLRDALSFLTIIRFYSPDFDAVKALGSFAYVGVLIGGVLATINILLHGNFVEPVLILICWVTLTGALHMDGLMDTADALFSHRDRERKLEIMKDSRSGAMAVVVAILFLSLLNILLSKRSVTRWYILLCQHMQDLDLSGL